MGQLIGLVLGILALLAAGLLLLNFGYKLKRKSRITISDSGDSYAPWARGRCRGYESRQSN